MYAGLRAAIISLFVMGADAIRSRCARSVKGVDRYRVPRSTVYGHLDKTTTVPRQTQEDRNHEVLTATDWLLRTWFTARYRHPALADFPD